VKKLLAEGKTDLLTKFISKKTTVRSRHFWPWQDGKVGFEFPRGKRRAGRVRQKVRRTRAQN